MRVIRFIGAAVVAAAAFACNSTTGSGGPGPDQVFLQNTAFDPATRTVPVGTTVTWMNQDGFAHTVTYSSGAGSSFNSGSVPAGGTFTHQFTVAGTVEYYCTIHGTPTTGMHATVIVQ